MKTVATAASATDSAMRRGVQRAIGVACGALLVMGVAASCGTDVEEPVIFSGTGQAVPVATAE